MKTIQIRIKKKIGTTSLLAAFLVIFMFVIKVVPSLQYKYTGTFWSLIYQVIFFLWIFMTNLKYRGWFLRMGKKLNSLLLWIVYLMLLFFVFPNTQYGYMSLILTFWEPLVIFYYYDSVEKDVRLKKIILWATLLAILWGLVLSIASVDANELAAREASSGHKGEDAVLTGNYTFTAMISIISCGFLGCLFSDKFKNKVPDAVFTAIIVSALTFIFRCNLMISILCFLIGFILFLVFGGGIRGRKAVIRNCMIAITLLVLAICWEQVSVGVIYIFRALGNFIGSTEITKKTEQIILFIGQGVQTGNLASRINLCKIAINTFLNHPIFGIGPQNNANIYFLTQLGLHATFFDEFARYGIVGIAIMARAFLCFYKYTMHRMGRGFKVKGFKAGFVLFFIVSSLNPVISANIGIALFYILPTVLTCYATKEDNIHALCSNK